ncbi:hypothetical protein AW27_026485 [Streptomyces sp. PCS3-D2]|uniref:hypothetical protein n=1 Tax=Streptomyces sp. PCS3-D2 TaxID=1460244 RepID=UPI00044BB7A1|nr:hypothetical protein [Streptomyces sp. PCS3-D2]WKV74250.1 hypothetical protein AW27_023700 [Streptomyces sp. PCS3-D2]WKV74756.1 hypothetical protein AW27_026485 [Streptomyces sp. PCS3-D2]
MKTPTPADLAARFAPAVLAGSRRKFRGNYLQAVRDARMIPHTKVVALVLGVFANPDGVIPANRQPGVPGLVKATGLTAGMVLVQLAALEQRQWIQPVRGARYETEPLQLSIPAAAMARVRGCR